MTSCIEIGISKLSCWLCYNFLQLLEDQPENHIKFILPGSHRKVPSTWLMPQMEDRWRQKVEGKLDVMVKTSLDRIIQLVYRKRRSDSAELAARLVDDHISLTNIAYFRSQFAVNNGKDDGDKDDGDKGDDDSNCIDEDSLVQ